MPSPEGLVHLDSVLAPCRTSFRVQVTCSTRGHIGKYLAATYPRAFRFSPTISDLLASRRHEIDALRAEVRRLRKEIFEACEDGRPPGPYWMKPPSG